MKRHRPLRRTRRSAWSRPAGPTSTATTASSPRSRPSCSTATSSSSTAAAPAPASSSTSMAPPACGVGEAIGEAGGWQHDTLTEDTDLSYRAQLDRLAVQIPPGHRVPGRAPHRDDRLQDPAGALGQRPHPDRQKNSAARAAKATPPSTPSSRPGTTSPRTSATRS